MRKIALAMCVLIFGARDKTIVITSNLSIIPLLCVAMFVATFAVSRPRAASATTISIVGTSAWASEFSTESRSPLEAPNTFKTAQVGTGGNSAQAGLAGILFFELPDLSAQPEITSAELIVELTDARTKDGGGQVPSFNVDLYFLGLRSELIVLADDYGDGGILPQAATLIQDNWWIANDDSQIGTSKSIAVDGEIEGAYTEGIPNDAFAVFALYGDINFTTNKFTTFFFEHQGPKPDLGITSVPEPSTFVLCALGVVSLATWRRWNGAARSQ